MTDRSLDELGPIDYVVVEFPAGASNFTGEMAQSCSKLVDAGTIRRDRRADPDEGRGRLRRCGGARRCRRARPAAALETELAELLAADDVAHLAAAMEPGSTAGVLIWENLWAAPFASAARRSGGQLIANGRIPIQAIIASIEADERTATEGE